MNALQLFKTLANTDFSVFKSKDISVVKTSAIRYELKSKDAKYDIVINRTGSDLNGDYFVKNNSKKASDNEAMEFFYNQLKY
jgi:glyceraldehyde-3-phosphate dehydrogenase/erythrose-4-phosphate dehydrogenase